MKKTLFDILRITIGILFLFSGFVKCIDPAGNAIKIQDYFVAWGLDAIPFSICMALSIAQNIIEFTAGYMLIMDLFIPIAAPIALLFMTIFTPLTLYIALANPVSDCGCFGDAVKLTNWGTFWKNIIFLPIAIAVFSHRNKYHCFCRAKWKQIAATTIGITLALLVSTQGITNEPIIDFRPYAVGTNIHASMQIPDDAEQPVYKTTFILEKNGQQQVFDENTYPYEDTTWHYVDTKTEVVSEGYVPPIKDFTLALPEGQSLTDQILASTNPTTLIISPKVEEISNEHVAKLCQWQDAVFSQENNFYIVTSSDPNATTQLSNRAARGFDYLYADETMLKTITRSNPGIIIIQNGIIIAKYHPNHITPDDLKNPLSTYLTNVEQAHDRAIIIAILFLVSALLIALYFNVKK